jgi:hypothetical protein
MFNRKKKTYTFIKEQMDEWLKGKWGEVFDKSLPKEQRAKEFRDILEALDSKENLATSLKKFDQFRVEETLFGLLSLRRGNNNSRRTTMHLGINRTCLASLAAYPSSSEAYTADKQVPQEKTTSKDYEVMMKSQKEQLPGGHYYKIQGYTRANAAIHVLEKTHDLDAAMKEMRGNQYKKPDEDEDQSVFDSAEMLFENLKDWDGFVKPGALRNDVTRASKAFFRKPTSETAVAMLQTFLSTEPAKCFAKVFMQLLATVQKKLGWTEAVLEEKPDQRLFNKETLVYYEKKPCGVH